MADVLLFLTEIELQQAEGFYRNVTMFAKSDVPDKKHKIEKAVEEIQKRYNDTLRRAQTMGVHFFNRRKYEKLRSKIEKILQDAQSIAKTCGVWNAPR